MGKLWSNYVFQQVESIWGIGFYKTMSQSLKSEFPGMEGFSATNLKYMKKFYMFYSEINRQQAVDDLEKIYAVP
ncbi:MAG: hypothetical protein J6B94_00330 [Lachnospiraceae bacterium]|nr:hypothetical protein [Lachnospiraceae bacterium]